MTSVKTWVNNIYVYDSWSRQIIVYAHKTIKMMKNDINNTHGQIMIKDIDHCPIEIIKGLTDKGQFQYLTRLMGPQEGTYLYTTQFHSLR